VTDPATGRGYLKRGSARRESDARKAMTQAASQKDQNRLASRAASKLTLAEYLEGWLAEIKPELEHRSWQREEQNAKLHIAPTIGRIVVERLNAQYREREVTSGGDG
jgi:hypothetical protein